MGVRTSALRMVVTFDNASLKQLETVLAYVEDMSERTVEYYLGWVEGNWPVNFYADFHGNLGEAGLWFAGTGSYGRIRAEYREDEVAGWLPQI